MGKNKQKKNEAAEAATSSSNKMSGKEFEKELAKLQVELVRLQTWVQAKKAARYRGFRRPRHSGQGWRDQPDHRTHKSARLPPRGIAGTL